MGNVSSPNNNRRNNGERGSLLYQRDRDIVFGHMKKVYEQQKSNDKPNIIFGFLCVNQWEVLINVKGAKKKRRIQIESECFNDILSLILLYYSEGEHPKYTHNHRKQRENHKECLVVETLYDEIYDDVMVKMERDDSFSPLPPLQLSRIEGNEYWKQKWKKKEDERECMVVETIYEEIFDQMVEIENVSSNSPQTATAKNTKHKNKNGFNQMLDDSLLIQMQNEQSDEMDGFVACDDGFFVCTEYSPEFAECPRDHHKSRRFDDAYYFEFDEDENKNDECSVI